MGLYFEIYTTRPNGFLGYDFLYAMCPSYQTDCSLGSQSKDEEKVKIAILYKCEAGTLVRGLWRKLEGCLC
ncbi:MAG: hypothetical protein P8Y73_13070 [Desulfuromonadales bacterium]